MYSGFWGWWWVVMVAAKAIIVAMYATRRKCLLKRLPKWLGLMWQLRRTSFLCRLPECMQEWNQLYHHPYRLCVNSVTSRKLQDLIQNHIAHCKVTARRTPRFARCIFTKFTKSHMTSQWPHQSLACLAVCLLPCFLPFSHIFSNWDWVFSCCWLLFDGGWDHVYSPFSFLLSAD
jgi:hypothetical protein